MPNRATIRTLKLAYKVLRAGLPQYLAYARPHVPLADGAVFTALQQVVAEQDELCERLADRLAHFATEPPLVEFPMEFTSTNDLAVRYTARRAADLLLDDAKRLRDCIDELALAPDDERLVAEAARATEAHAAKLKLALDGKPAA
ncbi:MAG: hypothetical protein ACRCT8_02225 [Lacipirellulaceae bacterium]